MQRLRKNTGFVVGGRKPAIEGPSKGHTGCVWRRVPQRGPPADSRGSGHKAAPPPEPHVGLLDNNHKDQHINDHVHSTRYLLHTGLKCTAY